MMQKEQKYEKESIQYLDGPDSLMNQKERLLLILSTQIQKQGQNKTKKENIRIQSNILNQVIELISNLWNYSQQLYEQMKYHQVQQDEFNSIKNIENFQGPHSSIIVQQDNQQISEMSQRISEQEKEIKLLKDILYNMDSSEIQQIEPKEENQFMVNSNHEEYSSTLDNEKIKMNNMVSEIHRNIVVLDNIIKKSMIISDQGSNHSKVSEQDFNLTQEQFNVKEEDLQNKHDQSYVSDVNSKKNSTIENLKNVKYSLQAVAKIIKENSEKQSELIDCKTELKELQNKIKEQEKKITQLQKIKRIAKYEEVLEKYAQQKVSKNKKPQDNNQEDIQKIFPNIQREQAQIVRLSQIFLTNKDKTPEQVIENQKTNKKIRKIDQPLEITQLLRQIEVSSKTMLDDATKLYKRANDNYYCNFSTLIQQQDYKRFIEMGIIQINNFQNESCALTQDLIEEMWKELSIPEAQQNSVIVQMIKHQQQLCFMDLPGYIKENEMPINELNNINLLLRDFIKKENFLYHVILSNNLNQKLQKKQHYINRLQFIENEIEKKSLNEAKNILNLIIEQLNKTPDQLGRPFQS